MIFTSLCLFYISRFRRIDSLTIKVPEPTDLHKCAICPSTTKQLFDYIICKSQMQAVYLQGSLFFHGLYEFFIGFCAGEHVQDLFRRIFWFHSVETLAHNVDGLLLLAV